MAFTLSMFRLQVDNIIGADNDLIPQLARERLIKAAVERYSHDAPDRVSTTVSGDGGRYYDVSAFASWTEGFSAIESIEYPAITIASDDLPTMLEHDAYDSDYWSGGTRYLQFKNVLPAATESFIVRYTIPYLWSASTTTTAVAQVAHGFSTDDFVYLLASDSTWYEATDERPATHKVSAVADVDNFTAAELQCSIPNVHFFAVCELAASNVSQALATIFSKSSDSTINLDAVDHQTKAAAYASRARELMRSYQSTVFGDETDRSEPYQAFVNWPDNPGQKRSRRWLTH